ncbi:MAG: hypothetical protein K6B68_15185 [Eubacterium sp.]|nr:hypothetical protein [Eubacterium sp.]
MNNDNKIFEMYEKYKLDLKDRIMAFHLMGYLENSNIDIGSAETIVTKMDSVKNDVTENDSITDGLLADKRNVLEQCLKYYEEIYAQDNDLMDKMLHDEYLLVIREYREKRLDRLVDIFRCVEEIMSSK